MLKCTLNAFENHNINKKYFNLTACLHNNSSNYKPKKALILEPAHVQKYIKDAPDNESLAIKVNITSYFNYKKINYFQQ